MFMYIIVYHTAAVGKECEAKEFFVPFTEVTKNK